MRKKEAEEEVARLQDELARARFEQKIVPVAAVVPAPTDGRMQHTMSTPLIIMRNADGTANLTSAFGPVETERDVLRAAVQFAKWRETEA